VPLYASWARAQPFLILFSFTVMASAMKRPISSRAQCLATLSLFVALSAAHAEVSDPKSAKNIAKPILMLMLYCHAALDTLQTEFEKSPPSGAISASKQKALQSAFELNKTELGGFNTDTQLFHLFHKSVEDKAISAGEAQFLEKTARKDATLWFAFAKEKCKKEIFSPLTEEEDECLNKLNSEMHKCFIGFNERVENFLKQ
jgi:hypothetical protein